MMALAGRGVADPRSLARDALRQMSRPRERLFAFSARVGEVGLDLRGRSHRYTAVVLMGLAGESASAAVEVLHGQTREEVSVRLLEDVPGLDHLGAVALIHWAATACGISPGNAARKRFRELLTAGSQSTVELSCTVAALSDEAASHTAAARLMAGLNESSDLFPIASVVELAS